MKIADKITLILCDDVREETGNKYSLMGVYGADLVFANFPALLPKLCLCIMLNNVKVDFGQCNVTGKLPETEPTQIRLDVSGDIIGQNITLFAVMVPFRAKCAGEAKIEVRFAGNSRPSVVQRFEIKGAPKKQ
ncbi:MAG: hypothetical protein SWE60_22490 [Thermodesulfobacteriota bacterium]|nr:hypothetical protein [Thermodesulfobacteriota bacterium]